MKHMGDSKADPETASASSHGFQVFVLSPSGTYDPSLPIAASRAGAVGLFDLTHLRDASRAEWAVSRFCRLSRGRTGLVVQSHEGPVEAAAHSAAIDLDFVVLSLVHMTCDLHDTMRYWREVAPRVGAVVTSAEEGNLAREAGLDYVVAKGSESGGIVGEETTFILLQQLLQSEPRKAVYAWGGIGLHTASACRIAGAAGVVLDWQLSLMRESPLPAAMQRRIQNMDGSETAVVPAPDGKQLRLYDQPDMTAKARLEEVAESLAGASAAKGSVASWYEAIACHITAPVVEDRLWPIGQEACCASAWARRAPTVGRALAMLRDHVDRAVSRALDDRSVGRGSPLAQSHGTTFPVVQGPMTRVSDVPEFCDAVERGGALPFLALALLKGDEARKILTRTQQLMGDRPWGVGILGFVPLELRTEQLAVIEDICPPYAIIAGGRPDQAAAMEAKGISTYLHVPSSGLLEMFVQEGARRFIFEGRECGGHVGPRSSFVLWDTMIQVLQEADLSEDEASQVHVLFAGGICDGLGAAMISAMAQPLVDRGMKIGVLLGTAYLYTQEAVSTGAIVDMFQHVAADTTRTVLLETGPGHAVRCAPTAYTRTFEAEKARLKQEGLSPNQIRDKLERANLGRLRIASKGIVRVHNSRESDSPYAHVGEDEQRCEGMYMIGQIAPICVHGGSIRQLHERVCDGATAWLESVRESSGSVNVVESAPTAPPPLDIAIVGMACLLPGAVDVEEFWHNILEKRDLIERVPPDRFAVDRWYDPQRGVRDKIYTSSGGFLKAIPFDPLKYGIPPRSLHSIEPVQLLALELVDQALQDAGCGGYQGENRLKERCSIILGAGGGAGELASQYVFRSVLPQYVPDHDESLFSQLPEWTEDSFAGILMNVIAGRVANRYDLGGVNFTVDAACASSLAAIYVACRELADGTSDMVIAGGCDTVQNPFGYLCFATAGALSPGGKSRAFDANADGIAISEGLGAVVLKRVDDAERDGDRIYAIIRAAVGGSDGRSMSMTAPRSEGQLRTYRRAYAQARFPCSTVELFEAHGTGTSLGDRTECQSLTTLLQQDRAAVHSSAIGSVKSNIGHTKCAAGVSGLMKAALALYHRVLPPTIHIEQVDPKGPLADGPLYANTELRPWVRRVTPRRAAVSAFGFGGTNFHVVLEDYEADALGTRLSTPHRDWPSELFLFAGASQSRLAEVVRSFAQEVAAARDAGSAVKLADLAYSLHRRPGRRAAGARAAVVVSGIDELLERLSTLAQALTMSNGPHVRVPEGTYFADQPLGVGSPLAMLFPGQGSQYPNMLRDLAVEFAEVRDCFERADRALQAVSAQPLSRFVFPVPAFSDEVRVSQRETLKATDVAQPALGVSAVGVLRLLESLGIRPEVTAGHSYGELVALHAAGHIVEDSLYALSQARGRAMADLAQSNADGDLGSMLAVNAAEKTVRTLLESCPEVWVANLNSPRQTVISGSKSGLAQAAQVLQAEGLSSSPVPVACAFHTPIIAPAKAQFQQALAHTDFQSAALPVFSNRDACPYPSDPDAIRQVLCDQLLRPVRFVELIEQMYESGSRVFVEVGPGHVLTKLVGDILADRPHAVIATQPRGQHGVTGLLLALGQMFVHGVSMELDRLYEPRGLRFLDLRRMAVERNGKDAEHLWLVNGAYARPASQPPRDARPKVAVSPAPAVARQAPNVQETRGNPMNPTPVSGESAAAVPATSSALQLNVPDRDPYALFQETMRQFLETQEAVMTSYFNSEYASERPEPPATLPRGPTEVDAAPAVAPPGAEADLQATRAEPTDKAVETASGHAVAATPPPSPDLEARLLEIVSERTGYPVDMLDLSTQLEAELGIDSIKRIEIIGAFRREAMPHLEEAPAWYTERMTAAGTLAEILVGVRELRESAGGPAVAMSADTTAAPAAPTPQQLEQTLTQLVSERTGYPIDMLEVNANLEADLGIDSIKRVEIVGALRRQILPEMTEPPGWFMDRMTSATTIRAVCEGLTELVARDQGLVEAGPAAAAPTAEAIVPLPSCGGDADAVADKPSGGETAMSAPARAVGPPAHDECPRCVASVVEIPLEDHAIGSLPTGVMVVTQDDRGVASALVDSIESRGGRAIIVGEEHLKSRATAELALGELRRLYGNLGGVVHLAPLREAPPFPGISPAEFTARLDREVKSLLFLVQALAPELGCETTPQLLIATASVGGGDFASSDSPCEAIHPWRGGLAGLLKTAALEYPNARFRCVDYDQVPDAQALTSEILAHGPVEVGYRGGRRLSVAPSCWERLDKRTETTAAPTIGTDSVVLVTGGGRGITAEIAKEIAARTQATIVLLGRTSLSPDVEDPATAAIEDLIELRRVLARQMASCSPKEISDRASHLLAEREVRRTLTAIESAGSKVEYIPCDASDQSAFSSAMAQILSKYDVVDVVIHGAGVIDDCYLVEKTSESFARVVKTKVEPILHLCQLLDPSRLKAGLMLSSVAGFFGNRGQSDYAAANEILNRMTRRLHQVWPGKMLAINWGPWKGAGMVTPEVARQFESRGVGMVTVSAGRDAAWRELTRAKNDHVRILVGPGPWVNKDQTRDARSNRHVDTPLLAAQSVRVYADGRVEAEVNLSLDDQPYLNHHRLDDKVVLPLTFAQELLSETVAAVAPAWHVTAITDLRMFSGITIEDGRCVRVCAEPIERSASSGQWRVRIEDVEHRPAPFYQANVHLAERCPAAPDAPQFSRLEGQGGTIDARNVYEAYLFHGPSFHVIEKITKLDGEGVDATLGGLGPEAGWLTNPFILDAAPQLAIVWSREQFQTTPLPNAVATYRRYDNLSCGEMEIFFRPAPGASSTSLTSDVWLVRDGKVLGRIEGLECAGSSSLNRLVQGVQR